MSRRLWLVLAAILLSSGCVASRPDRPDVLPTQAASNYAQVLRHTKMVPDPHAGWSNVYGPVVAVRGPYSTTRMMIRTRRDGGEQLFQIQVQGLFPKRVYLNSVYSAGQKLTSTVIDRERTDCGYGCTTIETIGVDLTEVEMDRYAASGITLEVIGRRDSIVVTIPAHYFAAVLAFHRKRGEAPP